MGVGGQYGDGALLKGGKAVGYYNTTGVSSGLQAGAQQFGYAMFFMDSVQRLRAAAQKAGNLKTNEQQKVSVEQQKIIIEPAQPQVVYVPAYNPAVVYGPWMYPSYPPYYWPPPVGYYGGAILATGIAWGVAIGVGPTVVVMDEGKAKSTTTTTMKDDIYAFIFSQQGLMAGLGLQGNKITKINPK